MPVLQPGEALFERHAHRGDVLDKTWRQHHVEHRIANARRERIATKRRSMRAKGHAPRRVARRQKGAERKSAADALGDRHDVGRDAKEFVSEELAGAADSGLHLVEYQKETMLVAKLAQSPEEAWRRGTDPALALNRFGQDGAGLRTDCGLRRLDIAEGNRVEALDSGTEALEMIRIARRSDRREGASMKCPGESNDAELFGMSARRLILARCFDGAFDGFRSGIGEKYVVGESDLDEAPGQAFRLWDLEQIGGVPDFRALLIERGDEMRVGIPERRHGDAAAEIEKPLARCRGQPSSIAPLEGELDAGIGGKQRRGHFFTPRYWPGQTLPVRETPR